jgi:hypothetical protein
MTNPFKPTAGSSPPELIGRAGSLRRIREAVTDGPGAPGRICLFTGKRGVGKTVMLNEYEDAFLDAGWLAVGVTATSTLLPDLLRRVATLLRQRQPPARRRLTGLSLPGGVGADWENLDQPSVDLRALVTELLDVLGPDRGVLVTIDEIHGGQRDQMREIAAMSQHLVREDRQFALAMAGLPSSVSNLLSDHVLTFLRRADRHDLRSLAIDDVEDALRSTVEQHGRAIDAEASLAAAEATEGYPFMVQLVGHQMWRAADGPVIDEAAVRRGVAVAKRRLRELVHETALNDLSDVDREFLLAMSVDDGPSSTAEIARRMGRSSQYANTYRGRLMAAGVIEAPARGKVDLSIPYLRETLRELS